MATKTKKPKSNQKSGGGKLGSTTTQSNWTVDSTTPGRQYQDHWSGKGSTKGKKNDGINALGSPAYNMTNQNKGAKKNAKSRTRSNRSGK